jgi:hypothetical protein
MHFSEDFLHFVWRFRLFKHSDLRCTDGQELKVLSPGILNTHAGPDFSAAKIRIGDIEWVGHVEIHIRSSDWLLHNHQDDAYYDSVILHVVYHHDQAVFRRDGTEIPVLDLRSLLPDDILARYQGLLGSSYIFPCQAQLTGVSPMVVRVFLSRLVVERLAHKSETVFERLEKSKGDWDEAFYYFVAKTFGFKVNATPFELLAGSMGQQILNKHKNSAFQIEALVFGQAGFLQIDYEEAYPIALKREYDFLKHKYQLTTGDVSVWKFLRMRPQNFPTIRLAQFSALIFKSASLFSKILTTESLSELFGLFTNLPVASYWQNHYHFNKVTRHVNLQLGKQSIYTILVNTVCLFLFCYGKYTDQQEYIDRALDLLEEIPAEDNAIVSAYRASGIQIDSAFYSQAVLQLNKNYCNEKKCLNCGIGIKILNK